MIVVEVRVLLPQHSDGVLKHERTVAPARNVPKMSANTGDCCLTLDFNILPEMPSGPTAILLFARSRLLTMLPSVTVRGDSSLTSVVAATLAKMLLL